MEVARERERETADGEKRAALEAGDAALRIESKRDHKDDNDDDDEARSNRD